MTMDLMVSSRTPQRQRFDAVILAAMAEARQVGLPYITRDAVARRAGVPPGSMCLFGSMSEIKEKVAEMDPSLQPDESLDRYEAARQQTDAAILGAAVALAVTGRYDRLTRRDVAQAANVSPARVSLFAGDMDGLRTAIMEAAVRDRVAAVVAQGLADRHPAAMAAPEDLKQEALRVLAGGA
jgi:AcrR family transcriptional regulator